MYYRVALQPDPSSTWPAMYTPETLRQIGTQLEAMASQHSSLEIHKRAIERQLASIAAQIREQDVVLIPRWFAPSCASDGLRQVHPRRGLSSNAGYYP